MAVLVLVVDRDNDVGVKAGLETPIVGRENVLKAAELLLLSDPEDSDGNTLFAAVKAYDELVSSGEAAEVAVVAGDPKVGILADMKIKKELEELFSKGKYDGIVFVSDGAEDDQVLPIVSSFAPIVSKVTVTVKQAKQLESAFYTLKTAIEDPTFARFFLGLPGLLLLLWFFLAENAWRIIAGLLGIYLVIKGFGLEEPLLGTLKGYLRFNPKSVSFPFHIFSLAVLIGGSYIALQTFLALPNPSLALYESLRMEGVILAVSLYIFLIGKAVEAVVRRESYKIGDYVLFGGIIFVLWLVGDVLLNFLEGHGSVAEVAVSVVVAVVGYYIAVEVGKLFRKAPLFSKNIVGSVLYDRLGIKLGKIKKVDPEAGFIVVERRRTRVRYPISRLKIEGRRVVLA